MIFREKSHFIVCLTIHMVAVILFFCFAYCLHFSFQYLCLSRKFCFFFIFQKRCPCVSHLNKHVVIIPSTSSIRHLHNKHREKNSRKQQYGFHLRLTKIKKTASDCKWNNRKRNIVIFYAGEICRNQRLKKKTIFLQSRSKVERLIEYCPLDKYYSEERDSYIGVYMYMSMADLSIYHPFRFHNIVSIWTNLVSICIEIPCYSNILQLDHSDLDIII